MDVGKIWGRESGWEAIALVQTREDEDLTKTVAMGLERRGIFET